MYYEIDSDAGFPIHHREMTQVLRLKHHYGDKGSRSRELILLQTLKGHYRRAPRIIVHTKALPDTVRVLVLA